MRDSEKPSFADGWRDAAARARQRMLNNLRPQLANFSLSCDESGFVRAHPLEIPVFYTPKRVPKAKFPTDDGSAYARGWHLALKEIPIRMIRIASRSRDMRVTGLWIDDKGGVATTEAAELYRIHLIPTMKKHGSVDAIPEKLMMEIGAKARALLRDRTRDARLEKRQRRT